jgi:hypothetical protein
MNSAHGVVTLVLDHWVYLGQDRGWGIVRTHASVFQAHLHEDWRHVPPVEPPHVPSLTEEFAPWAMDAWRVGDPEAQGQQDGRSGVTAEEAGAGSNEAPAHGLQDGSAGVVECRTCGARPVWRMAGHCCTRCRDTDGKVHGFFCTENADPSIDTSLVRGIDTIVPDALGSAGTSTPYGFWRQPAEEQGIRPPPAPGSSGHASAGTEAQEEQPPDDEQPPDSEQELDEPEAGADAPPESTAGSGPPGDNYSPRRPSAAASTAPTSWAGTDGQLNSQAKQGWAPPAVDSTPTKESPPPTPRRRLDALLRPGSLGPDMTGRVDVAVDDQRVALQPETEGDDYVDSATGACTSTATELYL